MTEPSVNFIPSKDAVLNISPSPNGSKIVRGTLQSLDFVSNASANRGFSLKSMGNSEINAGVFYDAQLYLPVLHSLTAVVSAATEAPLKGKQSYLTETNFRRFITDSSSGTTIWISDGTTPDGNLTGVVGDLCLNGAGGVPFYCDTAGKNWTALA